MREDSLASQVLSSPGYRGCPGLCPQSTGEALSASKKNKKTHFVDVSIEDSRCIELNTTAKSYSSY